MDTLKIKVTYMAHNISGKCVNYH